MITEGLETWGQGGKDPPLHLQAPTLQLAPPCFPWKGLALVKDSPAPALQNALLFALAPRPSLAPIVKDSVL